MRKRTWSARDTERERALAVLRGECPIHGARTLIYFGGGVFCVSCIDGRYYRRVSGEGTRPVYPWEQVSRRA